MCFCCLHNYRFLTPRKPIQSRDVYIINILQSYGEQNRCCANKRHIVVQCNNLFKAIFSQSEAEENQCKMHFVRMFRLLTKIFYDC